MKVKDLMAELSEIDPESEVILQKDSEGNGYSPLYGVDNESIYLPSNTWSGEVYDSKWDADDTFFNEDEWEELKKNTPRCVVLYPVN